MTRGGSAGTRTEEKMASISVTESQFRCPICLDILRHPVSIPCGHTYCMACINNYWDQAEPPGRFSCPQCRESFSPRPVLRRNTVLAEVVDKLRLSEVVGEPEELDLETAGDVLCDFCPAESRTKAGKSCLVCLASFCEVHVLPHREVGPLRRHQLVPAVERLAERLCAQHRLGVEPARPGSRSEEKEEQVEPAAWSGDYPLCEADQEEERRMGAQKVRRQLQLQDSQKMLQGRIQTGEGYLEELQQALDSLKVLACAVLEDSETLFADMAQCLERCKAEVRGMLEAKERAVIGRAERDIELLEKDLKELRRRDEEISLLLKTEDSALFLQATPLFYTCLTTDQRYRAFSWPTETFSDARKALCHLRSRMVEVCWEEVDRIRRGGGQTVENSKPQQPLLQHNSRGPVWFPLSTLSMQSPDQRMRAALLRFSCQLSLDPNTAHPALVLLEEPAGAHCGKEAQPYAPYPHRFDSVTQVLCREGLSGVSRYWEVEWRGGGWVDVGVTSLSIRRKGGGKPSLLGRNENSWRLRFTRTGFAAWHDNRKTTMATPTSPRIGVLLEPQKGALSFYSVSDSVVLLHKFNFQFCQPLYPAFRLDLDSTLLICPL